jgi:hypothetical protein
MYKDDGFARRVVLCVLAFVVVGWGGEEAMVSGLYLFCCDKRAVPCNQWMPLVLVLA